MSEAPQARATTDRPSATIRRKRWLPRNAPRESFSRVLLSTPMAIARAATAAGSCRPHLLSWKRPGRPHRSVQEHPRTRMHPDVPTSLRPSGLRTAQLERGQPFEEPRQTAADCLALPLPSLIASISECPTTLFPRRQRTEQSGKEKDYAKRPSSRRQSRPIPVRTSPRKRR